MSERGMHCWLMVGLGDLKGVVQPKQFCGSMIL